MLRIAACFTSSSPNWAAALHQKGGRELVRPRPGVAGTPPERPVGLLTAAAADNQEDASGQAPRPPQMLTYFRSPLHRATKLGMSSRHPTAVKGPSWLPEEQHLPMLLPAEHSNMLPHVHLSSNF